jgi:uncharacterized protein (DUF4415 family)
MKKEEKDLKQDKSEFSEKMKEMGWREIDRQERPAILQKSNPRNSKTRITIYLDSDLVEFFKETAEQTDEGYQTLINRALRSAIKTESVAPEQIKESLLNDKKFLQSLKNALAI